MRIQEFLKGIFVIAVFADPELYWRRVKRPRRRFQSPHASVVVVQ